MRRYALFAVLLCVVVLLSACSGPNLLIITDPYWYAGEVRAGRFAAQLARLSKERKVQITTVVVPYTPTDPGKLIAAIEKNRGYFILLSPLFSNGVRSPAARFADRLFIAFSSSLRRKGALVNLITLIPGPTSIFRKAGERVAEYLRDHRTPKGVERVAAVFPGDAEGRVALSSFTSGIERGSYRPELSTIYVNGDSDRGRLRRFIDDVRARHVALYVLAAPAFNAYAFELLKDSTTPVVTENWRYGATYSGKVLFSLDQDIPLALMKVVETMHPPADNEIRIPWELVTAADNS